MTDTQKIEMLTQALETIKSVATGVSKERLTSCTHLPLNRLVAEANARGFLVVGCADTAIRALAAAS